MNIRGTGTKPISDGSNPPPPKPKEGTSEETPTISISFEAARGEATSVSEGLPVLNCEIFLHKDLEDLKNNVKGKLLLDAIGAKLAKLHIGLQFKISSTTEGTEDAPHASFVYDSSKRDGACALSVRVPYKPCGDGASVEGRFFVPVAYAGLTEDAKLRAYDSPTYVTIGHELIHCYQYLLMIEDLFNEKGAPNPLTYEAIETAIKEKWTLGEARAAAVASWWDYGKKRYFSEKVDKHTQDLSDTDQEVFRFGVSLLMGTGNDIIDNEEFLCIFGEGTGSRDPMAENNLLDESYKSSTDTRVIRCSHRGPDCTEKAFAEQALEVLFTLKQTLLLNKDMSRSVADTYNKINTKYNNSCENLLNERIDILLDGVVKSDQKCDKHKKYYVIYVKIKILTKG